jgi:hypothetical protein
MQFPCLFGKGILAIDRSNQLSSRCGWHFLGFRRLGRRKGRLGWLGFGWRCDYGGRAFRLALSGWTFGWTRGWIFGFLD